MAPFISAFLPVAIDPTSVIIGAVIVAVVPVVTLAAAFPAVSLKDTVNLAEEMLGGGRGRPKKIRTDVVVDPLAQSLINPNQESSFNEGYINPKLLTGTEGLKSIMNYEDSRTPSVKGSFEYNQEKRIFLSLTKLVNTVQK